MPCEQRLAAAAVLQLVLDCCERSLDDGCELAALRWLSLVEQMPSRALLNVASLAENLRADEGDRASDDQPWPVRRIAVLGAGIMGEGIAAVNLRHNVPVVLQDASRDALDRCFGALADVDRHAAETDRRDARVTIATADEELRPCDLLIETIVENKDVKQRVLKRLSPHLRDDAVVASNTSTIPISQLAESIPHPERFCGIHFCNPVERMPLVEVVRGQKTSDATLRSVVRYARQIGKLPVVVNDCPGFLINRLLLLYMNEALTLYCEGVPFEQIEGVAKAFGMECGPFELFDVIGVDTAMYGGKLLWEAFPDRISLTPILPAMVKRSWLGKKQGRGFYRYDDNGHRQEVDSELQGILQSYVRPAGPRSEPQV
jgi:3-hydroxyacyl-CoA dehydrogenase